MYDIIQVPLCQAESLARQRVQSEGIESNETSMRRSSVTTLAYLARADALREQARRDLGRSRLSHWEFVNWLIAEHRIGLAGATWLLYRRSCVVQLRYLADRSAQAKMTLLPLAARLEATPEDPAGASEARTSAKKAKHLSREDLDKIVAELDRSRSLHSTALKNLLASTLVSGLRPCEWAAANLLVPTAVGEPYRLIVRCAKHSSERGFETRTLVYDDLSGEAAATLRNWMTCVRAAVETGTFATLIDTVSRLMRRVVRKIFPRRLKRPCPYSARHQALANFKSHYIEIHSDPVLRENGAAIVATLAGHISDLSATRHYARTRKGGTHAWPIPRALPDDVLNVRKRLGPRRAKFNAFLTACANVQTPD